ncbi:hypothetical protein VSR01_25795 [Actinacidiphila sp. DG2A-62]|uniref:hypothetical protein n=1 Tax=Actinacidiphila sp. DG2A-62 TaxID=3108821 RepID=UPI002DBDF419|nr:hypothetical protein [Actinacidiphila sp. DG2A-62]MEC3996734.1 hypothetical protein [Actinacidiphila sp. DG2A-62]
MVRHRDADGATTALRYDIVAGGDAYRGVSRTAAPAGPLRQQDRRALRRPHLLDPRVGNAWLTAITAAPADPPAVLAAHSRGFRRPDHYVCRVRRARLPGRR